MCPNCVHTKSSCNVRVNQPRLNLCRACLNKNLRELGLMTFFFDSDIDIFGGDSGRDPEYMCLYHCP